MFHNAGVPIVANNVGSFKVKYSNQCKLRYPDEQVVEVAERKARLDLEDPLLAKEGPLPEAEVQVRDEQEGQETQHHLDKHSSFVWFRSSSEIRVIKIFFRVCSFISSKF